MGHSELIPKTGELSPRMGGSALRGMAQFSPGPMAGPGWTQSLEALTELIQSPQDGATART